MSLSPKPCFTLLKVNLQSSVKVGAGGGSIYLPDSMESKRRLEGLTTQMDFQPILLLSVLIISTLSAVAASNAGVEEVEIIRILLEYHLLGRG